MPLSKKDQVLEALKTALAAGTDATVLRNSTKPETIPSDGLIIIRDGDPGEPEQCIGSPVCYYSHDVDVEIFVQNKTDATRETAFDDLMKDIGDTLESNQTLGGLAAGMTYGQPPADSEDIDGGADVKAAILKITLDYTTPTPLN